MRPRRNQSGGSKSEVPRREATTNPTRLRTRSRASQRPHCLPSSLLYLPWSHLLLSICFYQFLDFIPGAIEYCGEVEEMTRNTSEKPTHTHTYCGDPVGLSFGLTLGEIGPCLIFWTSVPSAAAGVLVGFSPLVPDGRL